MCAHVMWLPTLLEKVARVATQLARQWPQRMRIARPQRRPSHSHRTPSRLLRRASSRHTWWYGAGVELAWLCASPMGFETRSAHHQPICLRDLLAFCLKHTHFGALETAAAVADAATTRRDRAPMSEATYSSWMQLVMCVAEAVWRPRGDSARTAVATAHANCPSSARSQRQPLVWPMQPPIGVIVRQ